MNERVRIHLQLFTIQFYTSNMENPQPHLDRLQKKITFEWSNINLKIVTKDPKASTFLKPQYKTNLILNNINGKLESGQLLAIMGHSGCGKSSLLDILAARTRYSSLFHVSGKVLLNNKERNEQSFRRLSAYVLQDDLLYPHLTVLETLSLASHFYLPTNMDAVRKAQIVENVINELGLAKVRHSRIGKCHPYTLCTLTHSFTN